MLVSVYIPTRNRVSLLQAAIDSVLAQTYPNIELVVVDDASTDGTWEYLTELSSRHPNIVIIRHPVSKGACAARNTAILKASGEFCTGLDDDDEFKPAHVESLVTYWQLLTRASSEAPSCIFAQHMCRNDGEFVPTHKPGAVSHFDLFEANYIGNQVFAPREHFIGAGLFDENMPAWQDLEFFYRLLKKYGRARLLDTETYVFDISARPDRISVAHKQRVLDAAKRMIHLHGGRNNVDKQHLLLQVYSEAYGFSVTLTDVLYLAHYGVLKRATVRILKKYLLGLVRRTPRKRVPTLPVTPESSTLSG